MAKTNKGHGNGIYVGFEEITIIVLPFQPTYTCLKMSVNCNYIIITGIPVNCEAFSTPACSAQLSSPLQQPDEDVNYITPSGEER